MMDFGISAFSVFVSLCKLGRGVLMVLLCSITKKGVL